ncbi:hypothetical protein HPP92_016788 [Vanilla planifolia]|uniref:Uncharacterized protein n=1 Tax=Vanilla planifolia TaxID=51239 RepID=A0A835QK03_VANPL|nr:hypothetical protein HPP92_016788 [Vanilla planifolia]
MDVEDKGLEKTNGILFFRIITCRVDAITVDRRPVCSCHTRFQDLPTYNKLISGEFNPETDRSTSVKPFRILQREGAASSFSKEKSLASTTSVSKQCLRASICLSSFILLGLFIYGCSIYYRRSYKMEQPSIMLFLIVKYWH